MKKKLLAELVITLLITVVAGVAMANTYSETIHFGSMVNETYREIENSYEYRLSGLTTLPSNWDDLSISLTYKGNSKGGNGEAWFAYAVVGGSNSLIGDLSKSVKSNDWYVTTWSLSPDFFSWDDESSTWRLTVNLNDNDSPGMDKLKIVSSSLTVNTMNSAPMSAPVPVPGALILLGSGLLGLVGIGIRKKRVEHL